MVSKGQKIIKCIDKEKYEILKNNMSSSMYTIKKVTFINLYRNNFELSNMCVVL